MLGSLHDVHLSEHRLDDGFAAGVGGTPGLGAELSCHALWVSRRCGYVPWCGRWRLAVAQAPRGDQRIYGARRCCPEVSPEK